jgi:hypothetical protein
MEEIVSSNRTGPPNSHFAPRHHCFPRSLALKRPFRAGYSSLCPIRRGGPGQEDDMRVTRQSDLRVTSVLSGGRVVHYPLTLTPEIWTL